ncbi:GntR family transcriptional regulator [Citricoccus sp.]|uniref:FadR/GntR family transcriptional regulator n=1 Tax=Citricoccus sp. TaxID=1978372 RepID=UPI0028BEBB77|nr:GntR family transcriptional regulator [Citricoccus sp.]
MPSSLSTLTRQVVFAPLDDAGRTEMVVSRIRSAIALGLFADGEQLPNEVALAAQLAVSPVTLRDALRTVREEGLVRTTRGRHGGTFVVAPHEANTRLFETAILAKSVIELRDLIDWQAAVMCHAARLAADRALDREIEAMRMTVEPLGGAIDAIGARRLYSRFLIELSASARSSKISKTAISLQVEYGVLSTLVFRGTANRSRLLAESSSVLDALAGRDPEAARDRIGHVVAWMGEQIQEIRHGLTHGDPVVAARSEGEAS